MEDDLQWKTTSNGRQPPIEYPPIEDNLQVYNLISGDQTYIKNASNEDDLQWKTTK
jgi:hypothetical protein